MTLDLAHRPLDQLLESHLEGRRILISGHSGFVGSWLSHWLSSLGGEVVGLSLPPEIDTTRSGLGPSPAVHQVWADIRELGEITEVLRGFDPEIVFHLAAQALVLPSYEDPIATITTNVLGTANVLEAMRMSSAVKACVVITSDKCYATRERAHPEDDPLGGDDPYSASKGAAEVITHAYRASYFARKHVGIATARAGNILGGGDEAAYRVLPDCVRAFQARKPVELRHPEAVRPWQHVLDANAGYLRLAGALLSDPDRYAQAWNFGPLVADVRSVSELVEQFITAWRRGGGSALDPIHRSGPERAERPYLALNSSKARNALGWRTLLDFKQTVDWTAHWYYEVASGASDSLGVTAEQVERYMKLDKSAFEGTTGVVSPGECG